MKLTTKELILLKAIDASEYGDRLLDSVWTFTITDNSDLNPRSVPGIIASLLKKGLVITGGSTRSNDDDYNIAMTEAGAKAYLAVVGKSRKSYEAPQGCASPECTGNYNHIGDCTKPAPLAIDPIELQMAIEQAGDENNGTWKTEGTNVMRQFSGAYTIAEVESLLLDMKRVQAALDRITR